MVTDTARLVQRVSLMARRLPDYRSGVLVRRQVSSAACMTA
jgi:hypothetical protein